MIPPESPLAIPFLPNLRFAQPLLLLLLPAIPLLVLWARVRFARRAPRMRFSSTALLGLPRPTLRVRLRGLPRLLMALSLALAVVALARPRIPWAEEKRKIEGISIMLVMDVSESMRALDFDPDRLEKSKSVVRDFVKGRTNDLVGLVIFGKETFAVCPLTHDYDALDRFIQRLGYDLVDGQATAIGLGLANGVNKIKDSKTRSKVVILLTDGENNWGEIQPLTAADIAKELGVRVYTIGVGSQGVVKIPVVSPNGRVMLREMMSNIDYDTLRKIAEITGGQFFEATDGASLEKIYAQIDEMEKTRVDTNERNYFDELAHWFVVPALLLLGAAFLLERTWLRSFP